jgi:uncharacterized protein
VYNLSMVREVADRKDAIAALCRNHGVERLYLFGSAARSSSLKEVGDLDFLVRFKRLPLGEYAHNYFRLAEKLEDLFGTAVDLVELDAIRNPYFRESVDETKVSIYEIP